MYTYHFRVVDVEWDLLACVDDDICAQHSVIFVSIETPWWPASLLIKGGGLVFAHARELLGFVHGINN